MSDGLSVQSRDITITSNHQEFIVVRNIVDSDIWVGCNNLLLWGKLGALLELEVSNGSRQSEVAVNTSEVNKPTSSSDSCLLACMKLAPVSQNFDSS